MSVDELADFVRLLQERGLGPLKVVWGGTDDPLREITYSEIVVGDRSSGYKDRIVLR